MKQLTSEEICNFYARLEATYVPEPGREARNNALYNLDQVIVALEDEGL